MATNSSGGTGADSVSVPPRLRQMPLREDGPSPSVGASLFDSIQDPPKAHDGEPKDKTKVAALKTDGVKPLTALGPIVVILLAVLSVVLWSINPTAAVIVGLVALALLGGWLVFRSLKSRKQKPAAKRQAKAQRSVSERHTGHRPFSGFHGSHGGFQGGRRGNSFGGSNGNGTGRRGSTDRRGSRNPFHRDRSQDSTSRSRNPFRRSNSQNRNDSVDESNRTRRKGRETPSKSSSGQRRSWNPFANRRSSDSSGRHRSRSGGSDDGGSGKPRASGRSRRPWNSRRGDSSGGNASGGGRGTDSHGGRPRARHRGRWYRPWSWGNDRHGGGGGGKSNRSSSNPDSKPGPGPSQDGEGKRGWSDRWHGWWSTEDDTPGQYRRRYGKRPRRRWWWWGERYRGDYAEFDANYDYDPTIPTNGKHYGKPSDRPRGRSEGRPKVRAERMDQPAPEPGPHELDPSRPQIPAYQSVDNDGGSTVNGQIPSSAAGRPEAAMHEWSADANRASGIRHLLLAAEARQTAAYCAQSGDPYLEGLAPGWAALAARADEAVIDRVGRAATHLAAAAQAVGGGGASVAELDSGNNTE